MQVRTHFYVDLRLLVTDTTVSPLKLQKASQIYVYICSSGRCFLMMTWSLLSLYSSACLSHASLRPLQLLVDVRVPRVFESLSDSSAYVVTSYGINMSRSIEEFDSYISGRLLEDVLELGKLHKKVSCVNCFWQRSRFIRAHAASLHVRMERQSRHL